MELDIYTGDGLVPGAYGLPQLSVNTDYGRSGDGITAIRPFDMVAPVSLKVAGVDQGAIMQVFVNGNNVPPGPYEQEQGFVLSYGFFNEVEKIYNIAVRVDGKFVGKFVLRVDHVTGDLDYDGEQGRPEDIGILDEAIRSSKYVSSMDLNLDGILDQADREMLIEHPALGDAHAGDIDGNGVVDIFDFLTLKSNYGLSGNYAAGDVNGDGIVNIFDFLVLKSNYGL